jgi:hypothetical protein
MIKKLISCVRQIYSNLSRARATAIETNDAVVKGNMLAAKILIQQTAARGILANIQEAEFRVFSQWGEDGIIQYLIHQANVSQDRRIFVEFGVGSYREANTRFLLMNNNWRGLVMDSIVADIAALRQSKIHWQYDLTAISSFITKENINNLISKANIPNQNRASQY